MEEAQEQYKQLEQKLLEMDKVKQSLQEEKNKAVVAVEQEVINFHLYYYLLTRSTYSMLFKVSCTKSVFLKFNYDAVQVFSKGQMEVLRGP